MSTGHANSVDKLLLGREMGRIVYELYGLTEGGDWDCGRFDSSSGGGEKMTDKEKTFIHADDETLIMLIGNARQRLVFIAPGVRKTVAEALMSAGVLKKKRA